MKTLYFDLSMGAAGDMLAAALFQLVPEPEQVLARINGLGLPGVEARGELVYSFGVAPRKISLATMCKALSENPAKLYGMFPRKGIIAPGADADIVVYDPQADHILRAEDMVSRAGYTPYEGFVTHGSISQVWLRGRLMVENGQVIGEQEGQYIVRGKSAL